MCELMLGAEAKILLGEYLGRKVVIKRRLPKKYRIPEVDAEIRRERTIHEARIIKRVRSLGIPTPVIYDVDKEKYEIVMEYVEGIPLRDLILKGEKGPLFLLGKYVGRMHKNGIIHGDLTPMNAILSKDSRLVLVDFGLSEFSEEDRMRAIDLRVLKESLKSLRDDYEEIFQEFLKGYKEEFDGWEEVLKKLEEIEKMGRYVTG